MLSLKYFSKSSSRYLSSLCHLSTAPPPSPFFSTAIAAANPTTIAQFTESIKDWFKLSSCSWIDKIFEILSKEDQKEKQTQLLLSQLGLRLSERLVLDVLNYGNNTKKDVLSCLKFFDWAGHQNGFFHTNATFHAIFKILTKAKLMSLALDFLDSYKKHSYFPHGLRFQQTLVIGYAVSGKPSIALQLFGQMRFHGVDLDRLCYHVLLNSLVEADLFYASQMIVKQIRTKGFECHVTHSILVKNFCKQGLFDEAEVFLRGVVAEKGVGRGHGYGVSTLVNALCKNKMFEKAGRLIEEFKRLGVDMNPVYGHLLRDLVQERKVSEALEFLKSKQSSEGYVPEVFQYNVLLCRLLREKKFLEAWDVFIDMKKNQICPNKVTMNAVFCLLCKAGMMDVALELYNSGGPKFDLSFNSMAYNYLIRTLCEYKHIHEAFDVFKIFSKEGYFPDRRTFHILASALCHIGKIDNVMELIDVADEWNIEPSFYIYNKLLTALGCGGRARYAHLHEKLCRMGGGASRNLYLEMIYCQIDSDDDSKAFDLLVEMQEKGFVAPHRLVKAVIHRLCSKGNVEGPLSKLLSCYVDETNTEILSRTTIFNLFIDGLGHAKKPKLARAVFEMMKTNGLQPNLSSYILVLQSYVRNEEVSDAMDFFNNLPEEIIGRKLFNSMIVGLCKMHKTKQERGLIELAQAYFIEARSIGIVPSMECYEELIKELCMRKEYDKVVDLLDDIERVGRRVTSFIGNTLLFQSLKSDKLYKSLIQSRMVQNESSSEFLILTQLIGELSGCITTNTHIGDLEQVLEMCFPLNLCTYNILLMRFSRSMDHTWWLFNRIRERGFEPNRWTYDRLVQGLLWRRMRTEAMQWLDEMTREGFEPTSYTKKLMKAAFEPNRYTEKLTWGSYRYHNTPRYS